MEGLEFQVENFTLNPRANRESLHQEGGHTGYFRARRSRSRSRIWRARSLASRVNSASADSERGLAGPAGLGVGR